jgi:hypothetical protein
MIDLIEMVMAILAFFFCQRHLDLKKLKFHQIETHIFEVTVSTSIT